MTVTRCLVRLDVFYVMLLLLVYYLYWGQRRSLKFVLGTYKILVLLVVYVISMWHLRENNGIGLIQFSNHSNVIITSWPGFGDVYTDISCCYAPDGAVL